MHFAAAHAEPFYRRLLNGEAGAWTLPFRGALRIAAAAYGLGVNHRNAYYDRAGAQARLPVPVISVGNLTVGGTGKTPMVIELLRQLARLDRVPAVVARGYGQTGGPNDEQTLIQRRCPSAICVTDRDRVRGARRALELGADCIILDDGFQHRRLSRDLDIVLVDATRPFGFGHLLPRGLLREPLTALRRARAVVLTRCDQVCAEEAGRTEARLRDLAPQAVHVRCRHRVTSIQGLDGGPMGPMTLAGQRVLLFAGIANPRAFAGTVSALGATIVGAHWWPDHHHYTARDILLLARPNLLPHDALVTTEKDAVKLADLSGVDTLRILVVCVDLEFLGDGGSRLQELVKATVGQTAA
jgi:tetraacyldisaccharide 4'-kinase